MEIAYTWIAMLMAMAIVGLLARRVTIPYPILLVGAGLGIGLAPGFHPPPLDPNLILFFFLPVLVYREAFETSWRDFNRWLTTILMLSVGLVAATIIGVAVVAKWMLPEMPWSVAFVLGAVVSPTDTVAASAVLHRIHVPRRLSAILGGESLVNDATGLVALQLAIGVVASGAFDWLSVSRAFLWTVLGGVGVGVLVGYVAHEANRRIRDTTVLFTLSLVAPLIAFVSAHALHASGVLAVLAVGFWVSWRIHAIKAHTRYDLYAVWRLLAYIVDGLCFLLIGIQIPRLVQSVTPSTLSDTLFAGGIVTLAVILIRILFMFPAVHVPLRLSSRLRAREGEIPSAKSLFLASWCGMRGAISMAAAMSVPVLINSKPFPGRDELLICTFCVIIGTLVVQGLTLHPLIRWVGITGDANAGEEERLTRISMMQAALSKLDQIKAETQVDPDAITHVEATYMERLRLLISPPAPVKRCHELTDATGSLFAVEFETLLSERNRLLELRDSGDINDLTHIRLQEELDMIEMRAVAHTKPTAQKPHA